MKSAGKFIFVPNRLGQLLKAPGGISRDDAMRRAKQGLETLRDSSVDALWEMIANIESTVVAGNSREDRAFSLQQMKAVLDQAESIINYAGLFGYDDLDSVSRCLCRLVIVMLDREIYTVEPIAVHVRAMRLVGPGAGERAPAELRTMHAQLSRILEYFLKQPLGKTTDLAQIVERP